MRVELLSGLTVVELGDGIAGSVAGAALAEMGAQVIKEIPVPRLHQQHAPRIGGAAISAISGVLDRSKIATESDRAKELALSADLVIVDAIDREVTTPSTSGVTVVITPFGMTGPDASRKGGELIAAAAGGLLATIEPEGGGRPVSPPGFVASKAIGAVAALAALHGLDLRHDRAKPFIIDVSAQEAIVFTGALPECAHVMFNCPGRAGSGRYVAPSGVFPCADGQVRIAAIENHQWQGMVTALGAPGWTAGLEDRPARAEQADLINEKVAEWTSSMGKVECANLLQHHGVPVTPVNLPGELIRSPQLAHRGSVQEAQVDGQVAMVLGPPWRVTQGLGSVARPPRLRGLRILELTHVLAGPIVGALLGAMGAKVVRLEDRSRLDIYRRTGPFADGVAGEERGAYFAVANHSKSSVVADGDSVAKAAEQLLERCDVVIENVGSARLDRLGVDPEKRSASGVLTLRVSGFGSDGPMADYKVYANNVQAYGGLTWMTRDRDGGLARFGSVLADPLSSVIGATVIAAWALGPQRGVGGICDLAMVEVVAGCISEFVTAASVGVGIEPPPGNDLEPYAPHGVYLTGDGHWVAVAIQEDEEWHALLTALECPPELARDPWRDKMQRFADRRLLDDAMDSVIGRLSSADVVGRLRLAGLRVAEVLNGSALVDDPHLQARGFFPSVRHPDLGEARVVGLPWRIAGGDPVEIDGAPRLGSTSLEGALEQFRER